MQIAPRGHATNNSMWPASRRPLCASATPPERLMGPSVEPLLVRQLASVARSPPRSADLHRLHAFHVRVRFKHGRPHLASFGTERDLESIAAKFPVPPLRLAVRSVVPVAALAGNLAHVRPLPVPAMWTHLSSPWANQPRPAAMEALQRRASGYDSCRLQSRAAWHKFPRSVTRILVQDIRASAPI